MVRRPKSSPTLDPKIDYRCIVEAWSIQLGSGAYSGALAEKEDQFFEEMELCAAGRLAEPFRGLDRMTVNINGNPAGIRYRGSIGSMRMETDHVWSSVEVSPDHFATLLTAFAAGKVKLIYPTAKPAKKRSNVPVSMIVLSTHPVGYLEE